LGYKKGAQLFKRENVEMTRCAVATIILIFLAGSFAFAQDSTPKVQVFGGYAFTRAGTGGLTGLTLNTVLRTPFNTIGTATNFGGWNAEAQYNLSHWLGVVADASGRYGTPITALSGSGGSGPLNAHAYTFMVGPVLSYRLKRMTPFVHALFGWDRIYLDASTLSGPPNSVVSASTNYTDLAMAGGGGLDYKLFRHVAVRVGQLDYIRTSHDLNALYNSAFGQGRFEGLKKHEVNLRASTGIVVQF
jgi:opacity protein-like surface antigen